MHTEFVARREVRILGRDYPAGAVIDDRNIPPGVLAVLTSTRRITQRINDGTVVDIPIDQTGSRKLHPMVQPGSGPSGLYQPEQRLEARTLLVDDTVIRSGYEPLTFRTAGEEPRGPNRPPYEPHEVPEGIPPPPAPPRGPAGDPVPNHQPSTPEPPSEAPEAPDDHRADNIDAMPWREAWQAGVAVRPGFTGTFRAYLMARCGSAEIVRNGSITDLLIRLTEAGIQPVPKVATKRPVGTGKSHGRPRKPKEALQ